MKIIRITESQYKRFLESADLNQAPSFNGKNKEYYGSETTIGQNITDANGDIKRSKPLSSDDFADMQTTQNYWFQGIRHQTPPINK